MRTKNFKAVAAVMFERCGVNKGLLPVVGVDGNTYYLSPTNFNNSSAYPYSVTLSLTTGATSAGFCVGTSSVAATENDSNLVNQIISGLTANIQQNPHLDENGNPVVDFDLMITNTGASPVVIGEIGFRQNLYTATVADGTSLSNRLFLLDRTVLASPVTIEAGAYAVIRYTMKTTIS